MIFEQGIIRLHHFHIPIFGFFRYHHFIRYVSNDFSDIPRHLEDFFSSFDNSGNFLITLHLPLKIKLASARVLVGLSFMKKCIYSTTLTIFQMPITFGIYSHTIWFINFHSLCYTSVVIHLLQM